MQVGPEDRNERNRWDLIQSGLSKQFVDKLTADEVLSALADLDNIVELNRNPKARMIPADMPLYPKTVLTIRNILEKTERTLQSVEYKHAVTTATKVATTGLDLLEASGDKCYQLVDRVIHTLTPNPESNGSTLASHSTNGPPITPAPNSELNNITSSAKLIEAYIADTNSWIEKADVLFRLGRFREAATCYTRFLELSPSNIMAWNNRGACLFNLAKYSESIACFDKSLEHDPRNAQTWYGKACAAIKSGQADLALDCLEKAVEFGSTAYSNIILKSRAFSTINANDRFVRLTNNRTLVSKKQDYLQR